VNGDDANSNKYVEDIMETAKKEGWILNPQWHNPGSQGYIEPNTEEEVLKYVKGENNGKD
jgi:hypothetical protein